MIAGKVKQKEFEACFGEECEEVSITFDREEAQETGSRSRGSTDVSGLTAESVPERIERIGPEKEE